MEFRKELQEFLKKNGISQTRAGEGAGYTGSVVSQYLAGTYKGNVEEVEAALKKWVARDRARRTRKSVPIIQTETMTRITNALVIAHEEKDIAVITGLAGVGKTTALEQYAEANPHSVVLIKGDRSVSPYTLIQMLGEAIGEDRKGGFADLVKRVCRSLRDKDLLVIIDEADSISDGALELARQVINDKGESGLVMVGLPRLIFRLRNLKNDHEQLVSRVGVLLQAEGIKKSDAKAIVTSVWPDADKEVVESFLKIAGASVRLLVKLINKAWRTAVANGIEMPDAETIQVAGALILRQQQG